MSTLKSWSFDTLRLGMPLMVMLAWAEHVQAQGFGVRGGVGLIHPGYVGAHYDIRMDSREGLESEPERGRELWFRPSVEANLGDREGWLPRTTINLEFRTQKPIASRWARYSGIGMTVSTYRRDEWGWREDTWGKGMTLVAGLASRTGAFVEVKLDPSMLKFGVGYTFKRR